MNIEEAFKAFENRKYVKGGHLYVPSASIKKRIANWEGSSMKTNRSFEDEARDFNNTLPEHVRSNLSQQQLDALFSYGYNVGMGKLKERTLPTLMQYVDGKVGGEDVTKTMWATLDPKMKGLRNRRNWEKSYFIEGTPAGRQQSIVNQVLNMDLSNVGQQPQQPLFESNPTEYSTPEWMKVPEVTLDDNNPTTPLQPQEEPEPQNNGLGLLRMMNALDGEEPPFTGYDNLVGQSKPSTTFSPFNNTLLDNSWFKDGGYIGHRFDEGSYIDNQPSNYEEYRQAYAPIMGEINSNFKEGKLRNLTERDGLLFDTNELQVADELRNYGLEAPMLKDYSTTLPNVTVTAKRPNPAEDIDKVILGSMALGTAPIALPEAAASAILPVNAASDALAATTLGKAAIASSPTWGPLVDAGMTSYFGSKDINDIYNGNANAWTALEITPLGRLVKPVYNGLKAVP